jgi:hypothetical protein
VKEPKSQTGPDVSGGMPAWAKVVKR